MADLGVEPRMRRSQTRRAGLSRGVGARQLGRERRRRSSGSGREMTRRRRLLEAVDRQFLEARRHPEHRASVLLLALDVCDSLGSRNGWLSSQLWVAVALRAGRRRRCSRLGRRGLASVGDRVDRIRPSLLPSRLGDGQEEGALESVLTARNRRKIGTDQGQF